VSEIRVAGVRIRTLDWAALDHGWSMVGRSSTDKPALRSADRRQHEQFNGARKKTRPKKEVEAAQGGIQAPM
jgi:hypothetical protein